MIHVCDGHFSFVCKMQLTKSASDVGDSGLPSNGAAFHGQERNTNTATESAIAHKLPAEFTTPTQLPPERKGVIGLASGPDVEACKQHWTESVEDKYSVSRRTVTHGAPQWHHCTTKSNLACNWAWKIDIAWGTKELGHVQVLLHCGSKAGFNLLICFREQGTCCRVWQS